jgi:S-DNA-T family DNA segregation ATPase FtsK/SpoIIIE
MTSLWDPIPVGVDEDGNGVEVSLPERNVLIGGEPGAGKSVGVSMLVAAAALDPYVHLSLFDGKLVELAVWRNCADHFVGPDLDEAMKVLEELRCDMLERYRYLLSEGNRKITRADTQFPLRLVVVDELALFTATGDKKLCAEFSNLLRDLVSRGRAAGIIVVAATQKPSSDIVPTALRDLFGFRWALRCSTPQASDTILGSGWATQGFTASSIEGRDRGVGLLLSEGETPVRLKAYYLSDGDLKVLARRAEQVRSTDVERAS